MPAKCVSRRSASRGLGRAAYFSIALRRFWVELRTSGITTNIKSCKLLESTLAGCVDIMSIMFAFPCPFCIVHVTAHAACPCPCCMSVFMQHVHVHWHVHVHAACLCPCCRSMFMLHAHAHAHAACSCCMVHAHAHSACPCCLSTNYSLLNFCSICKGVVVVIDIM